jgi:hypothetical protein
MNEKVARDLSEIIVSLVRKAEGSNGWMLWNDAESVFAYVFGKIAGSDKYGVARVFRKGTDFVGVDNFWSFEDAEGLAELILSSSVQLSQLHSEKCEVVNNERLPFLTRNILEYKGSFPRALKHGEEAYRHIVRCLISTPVGQRIAGELGALTLVELASVAAAIEKHRSSYTEPEYAEGYFFHVEGAGDSSVGIHPINESVMVHVKHDSGDKREFEEHMRSAINAWFDDCAVEREVAYISRMEREDSFYKEAQEGD